MSELASAPSGAAAPRRASTHTSNRPGPAAVSESLRPAVEVTAQAAPDEAPDSRTSVDPTPVTAEGAVLVGRYRLGTRVGFDTAAGAEFWRAEDTVLQRDVAVTVLRRLAPELGPPDDPTGAARAGRMVVRALRSGNFEHRGCARLLDVLTPGATGVPEDVLGAAVTEWVPGASLAETVADGLVKPVAAARAVAPLAAAAEEAHRHGLVLGCDHPQRVRITPDGRAQLCFAMPRPDLTPADDVRGLGALLYTLLTSSWPLAGVDATRAGLTEGSHPLSGGLEAPSSQRPGVPLELDTLTMGALGPSDAPGHVHTAAAMHRLLTDVVEEDDRIVLLPPARDGVPSAPGDIWQDGGRPGPPSDPRYRRKLAAGLVGLAVTVLVVLGYIGVQIGSLFVEAGGPAIVVGAPVGPSDRPPAQGPGGAGGAAAVANVGVYDNGDGDGDNAGRIARVIDGDVRSFWRTFEYRQQFPALKPGVGIMVSFASAVQLSALTIDSPSSGTVVEVRSAPSADAPFEETVPITETTLENPSTAVSLAQSQPVTHVLLWITKLGGGRGGNVTQINEVAFQRAGA